MINPIAVMASHRKKLQFPRGFPAAVVLLGLGPLSPAFAGIDSGGGHTSNGSDYIRSSIGSFVATTLTASAETKSNPGLIRVIYPITALSTTDVNANGLPDGWELLYFGSLGTDPAADSDNDNTSNLLEYLAATNPKNPASVFRPRCSYAAGIFQMTIPTVSGRNYQIWVSRDLHSWTMQCNLSGDNTERNFLFDETTITSGPLFSLRHPSDFFFRIKIQIP